MKELHNLPAQPLPLHQFPDSDTPFHGASAERVRGTAGTPGDSSPPLLSAFRDSARIKGGRLGLPRSNSSTPAISSLSAESTSCAVLVFAFPVIMSCRVRSETKAHRRKGLEICFSASARSLDRTLIWFNPRSTPGLAFAALGKPDSSCTTGRAG